MKKFAILLGLVAAVLILWLRGGLLQEPLSTLLAAAKLEIARGTAVALATEPPAVLVKTHALDDFLTKRCLGGWDCLRDWERGEQMGSGTVFTRGDQKRVVVCRAYSTRFTICQ